MLPLASCCLQASEVPEELRKCTISEPWPLQYVPQQLLALKAAGVKWHIEGYTLENMFNDTQQQRQFAGFSPGALNTAMQLEPDCLTCLEPDSHNGGGSTVSVLHRLCIRGKGWGVGSYSHDSCGEGVRAASASLCRAVRLAAAAGACVDAKTGGGRSSPGRAEWCMGTRHPPAAWIRGQPGCSAVNYKYHAASQTPLHKLILTATHHRATLYMQGGHCVPLAEDVAFGADPYIASSSIAARTAFTSYEQAHRGRMDAAEESRGQGMSPQLQGSLSNATTQLQLWLPAVRQLVAAGAMS